MIAWRRQIFFLCVHTLAVGAGILADVPRGEALFGLGMVPDLWGLIVVAGLPVASIALLSVMLARKCPRAKALNGAVFVSLALPVSLILVLAGT